MTSPNLPVEAGALAPYADASAYTDRNLGRWRDIDYYVRICRRATGPVLECGCGNGRVTLPLARAGVRVVGVDVSRPMLDDLGVRLQQEATAVRRRVSFRHADMRQLTLRRRFAAVLAPFDTFCHLYNRRDAESFLAVARRHLTATGQLVFDLTLRSMRELAALGVDYDPMAQVSRRRLGRAAGAELSQRHYHPEELRVLLAHNGFSHIRLTADYSGRALHEGAKSVVVTARPASC